MSFQLLLFGTQYFYSDDDILNAHQNLLEILGDRSDIMFKDYIGIQYSIRKFRNLIQAIIYSPLPAELEPCTAETTISIKIAVVGEKFTFSKVYKTLGCGIMYSSKYGYYVGEISLKGDNKMDHPNGVGVLIKPCVNQKNKFLWGEWKKWKPNRIFKTSHFPSEAMNQIMEILKETPECYKDVICNETCSISIEKYTKAIAVIVKKLKILNPLEKASMLKDVKSCLSLIKTLDSKKHAWKLLQQASKLSSDSNNDLFGTLADKVSKPDEIIIKDGDTEFCFGPMDILKLTVTNPFTNEKFTKEQLQELNRFKEYSIMEIDPFYSIFLQRQSFDIPLLSISVSPLSFIDELVKFSIADYINSSHLIILKRAVKRIDKSQSINTKNEFSRWVIKNRDEVFIKEFAAQT